MDYIDKKLQKIFKTRTGIDFQHDKEKREDALLGKNLDIPPRELILIYLDIEKEFGIEITEKEIIGKNFSSYNKIKKLLKQAI